MTKREPEMEAAEKAWEESITPGKIICTDDTSSHGLIKAGFIVGYAAGRASREGLREALESISRNTCCELCQQAKLVALAALESEETLLRRPGDA